MNFITRSKFNADDFLFLIKINKHLFFFCSSTLSIKTEEQNSLAEDEHSVNYFDTLNEPNYQQTSMNLVNCREKSVKKRRKKSEVFSPFSCHVCNKCYTRKHDLTKHVLIKHPEEKNHMEISSKAKNAKILQKCKVGGIFKCEFCDSKFQRSQVLLIHRRIHTREKPLICHICGKQFISLSAAKRHIDQVHHKIKKVTCEICHTRFDSNDKKEEHMNTHTDERPFMCAVCGKSFRQRASLFAHKINHSENYSYDCRLCGKKFKRKSEAKHHETTHTGEKRFLCEICPKSFSGYQSLKKHSLIHTKYCCNECGSSFGQKKLLNVHNDVHHDHNKITL